MNDSLRVARATDESFLAALSPEQRNAWEIAMLDIRMHAVEDWQRIWDARSWILVGSVLTTCSVIVLHTLKLIP